VLAVASEHASEVRTDTDVTTDADERPPQPATASSAAAVRHAADAWRTFTTKVGPIGVLTLGHCQHRNPAGNVLGSF
jgi:hypothetical protein